MELMPGGPKLRGSFVNEETIKSKMGDAMACKCGMNMRCGAVRGGGDKIKWRCTETTIDATWNRHSPTRNSYTYTHLWLGTTVS